MTFKKGIKAGEKNMISNVFSSILLVMVFSIFAFPTSDSLATELRTVLQAACYIYAFGIMIISIRFISSNEKEIYSEELDASKRIIVLFILMFLGITIIFSSDIFTEYKAILASAGLVILGIAAILCIVEIFLEIAWLVWLFVLEPIINYFQKMHNRTNPAKPPS